MSSCAPIDHLPSTVVVALGEPGVPVVSWAREEGAAAISATAIKLRELKELFLVEATKYNVFPLDNSVLPRILAARPSATAGRDVFTYTGAMPDLPYSDAPSILNRSYTITAEIEVPEGGGDGMIATMGGRFGGYGFYVLKGKLVFTYNFVDLERFRWEGPDALAAGKHTLDFDFKYDGPGFGKGGSGTLKVDGKEVASRKAPHTIPFLMTIDESFDIGSDTRTPVDDKDYQVPFPFTGKIDKLTIKLGPPQLAAADHKVIEGSSRKSQRLGGHAIAAKPATRRK
jgi:hypothetical protein